MTGYTDGSSDPQTARAYAAIGRFDASDGWGQPVGVYSSFTMPVRKGDYWKVAFEGAYIWGYVDATAELYWIPLGDQS